MAERLDLAEGKRLLVVPREKRPPVSVEFSVRAAPPDDNAPHTTYVNRIDIKLRSHRAYRVVTPEDAQWMFQVIHEFLPQNPAPTQPRRRSRRSSPAEPTTSASAAESSTSTAAASARTRRRTRQS